MSHPICRTCGVQYHEDDVDPHHCRICEDERQYVGWGGQRWVTLDELRQDRRNRIAEERPGVWGIGSEPGFGIGQRALLVPAADGNVLFDCVSLIDGDTVAEIERLGGLTAIAISHPHFYGSMIEWSRAFGDIPIYIHERDARWVCRNDGNVVLWKGDHTEIAPGVTLVNCAAHFDGGTVLHWADGEAGEGALFSGDIFQVVMDRQWVSFMYSYPNLIPEHPETVRRALSLVEHLPFRTIYGAFWGRVVADDGKAALVRSAKRYLRHVGWQL
jgi:hypothetical protein